MKKYLVIALLFLFSLAFSASSYPTCSETGCEGGTETCIVFSVGGTKVKCKGPIIVEG